MKEEDFYKERIEIERNHHDIEKNRESRESRFFQRNFGPIIIALATLFIAITSLLQIYTIKTSRDREIEIESIQKEKELELMRLQNERRWGVDLALFIAKNKDLLFEGSDLNRKHIYELMVSVFPPEITKDFLKGMEINSNIDTDQLTKARENDLSSTDSIINIQLRQYYLKESSPTTHPIERDFANKLKTLLESAGYKITITERPPSPWGWDTNVLFNYRKDDLDEARRIIQIITNNGINVELIDVSGAYLHQEIIKPRYFRLRVD